MMALFKNELRYSPFPIFCLGVGWVSYVADTGSAILTPQLSFMLGFFLTAGVAGAALTRELRDTTGGGYGFLRTLPVTTTEIVRVKFLTLLLDVTIPTLLILLLYSVLAAEPGVLTGSCAYVTAWSLGTLILISLWYCLVYRFGFGSPTLGLTLLLLGVLLPLSLYLDKGLEFETTVGFPSLIASLAASNWLVWLLILSLGLLAYIGLFHLAVRLKECKYSH